ncbi:AsmA-like C-terminal region-containing protein [Polaromonas sp. Pch-P]|uniref:AsmA-like C-terminal region-containing protein n=1 Tax=Polaromonas sp. Pch-P TaxID=2082385 RepID=UPI001E4CB230|nr:AsmA-like C-terminal region-containing protein [Polaromonas sp. Pch-P]
MKRGHKWLAALGVVVLLAGAAWVAALRYLPSDEELAQRASAELETALGVKVRVGALHWRLFPSPAVVMEDAATDQPQPILIKKLTAYPDLFALLQRRIKIDRADLDGATVPQLSLRGLGKGGEAKESSGEELPLARFVFRDVTWITRRGIPAVYEGDVDFDPGWRPRRAELRRPGAKDPTQLTLARNGQDDRWAVRIQVGGGTAHGDVQLDTRAGGRLHLEGKLQPKDIEVESMMSAFNRRSPIGGRVSGDTTLTANGDTVGELAQSLHTQTLFSMGKSTLLRFDLDKAVRTAGKEHDGQTPLESITGRLDTQNTPQGMVVTYTGVKAASGSLTASGEAKIANRRIEGEFAVDLVDGIVGVPLTVSGRWTT